jgi:hypothetical protein
MTDSGVIGQHQAASIALLRSERSEHASSSERSVEKPVVALLKLLIAEQDFLWRPLYVPFEELPQIHGCVLRAFARLFCSCIAHEVVG